MAFQLPSTLRIDNVRLLNHLYHPLESFQEGELEATVVRQTPSPGEVSVWRGLLSWDDKTITILCKEATSVEELRLLLNEVDMYAGQLKVLQGQHIPKLLGLYTGDPTGLSDTAQAEVYGIALWEDCGTAIESWNDIRKLDRTSRMQLARSMYNLHDSGICFNNDIHPSINILQDSSNGSLRVMNFTNAARHECRRDPSYFNLRWDGIEPNEAFFGCHELWQFMLELEAWKPNVIYVWNVKVGNQRKCYPIHYYFDNCLFADRIYSDGVLPDGRPLLTREEAYLLAEGAIRDHAEEYYTEVHWPDLQKETDEDREDDVRRYVEQCAAESNGYDKADIT